MFDESGSPSPDRDAHGLELLWNQVRGLGRTAPALAEAGVNPAPGQLVERRQPARKYDRRLEDRVHDACAQPNPLSRRCRPDQHFQRVQGL
jgi:hypothetical protein